MTVVIDWRDTLASAELLAAVEAPVRTISGRAELVDYTGTPVPLRVSESGPVWDLPFAGATVEFRGEQAEQFSGRVTFTDPTLIPTHAGHALDPRAALMVRLWWRIYTAGAWLEVPIMTGIPEDPESRDAGTTVTTMALRDPIAMMRGGYGGVPLVVSGLTVTEAIAAIFGRCAPTLRVTIEDSTVTLPADYVLCGRTPMEDVGELAGMGYTHGGARTSRDGSIRVGSRPEPTGELDWQEGPTCAVSKMTRSLVTSRMGNRQTVLYSGSDEAFVGVYYTAEDEDPTSPTWVGGPWGAHPLPDITTDAATTTEACKNLADMNLGKGLHPVEDLAVVIPQRPDLEYRKGIRQARVQLGVGDTYRVSSYSLELPATGEPPALMSVRMMERTAE